MSVLIQALKQAETQEQANGLYDVIKQTGSPQVKQEATVIYRSLNFNPLAVATPSGIGRKFRVAPTSLGFITETVPAKKKAVA